MRARTWCGLALLAVVALAVRLGLTQALTRGDGPRTYEHGEIAANLLSGGGFRVTFLGQEGPTSQQAPLYPLLLAGAYAIWGVDAPAAVLAVQCVQCAAGAALVLAVVGLAWLVLPGRESAGWCAGLVATVYPPHVYMVTHIQVAVWAALLLTLLAATVLCRRWRGSRWAAALAGLLGGLLLLVEPILALALPILALAMLVIDASRTTVGPAHLRNGLGWLARPVIFAAVAVAVVSPWIWRNWRVHGEFVFIKSTFGYAFWQGNNAASWGTDKIPKPAADVIRRRHDGSLAGIDRALWQARHETLYIDDVLLKPNGYRQFAGLSEPARCRLLGREARAFIADQPRRYLELCGQRLRYFLLWDETNPKAAHPVYRGATLVWLALAAGGLWLARREAGTWWPLLAICAAVTVFHALTITSARFRIPLEPLTFVWAGATLSIVASRVSTRLWHLGVASPPRVAETQRPVGGRLPIGDALLRGR
jgi:hypothetical protein